MCQEEGQLDITPRRELSRLEGQGIGASKRPRVWSWPSDKAEVAGQDHKKNPGLMTKAPEGGMACKGKGLRGAKDDGLVRTIFPTRAVGLDGEKVDVVPDGVEDMVG